MAPCTLTDLIVPQICILTSVDMPPESKNLLKKGSIPEENGNKRECNKVGEAIPGPSSMDITQSPSRHIPTTSVTTMMIQ